MISRRLVSIVSIIATAVSCFTVAAVHLRRHDLQARAEYEKELRALRVEMRAEIDRSRSGIEPAAIPAATSGKVAASQHADAAGSRARMVAEIKQELQSEMGLLPVQLLRERRSSFVELYSYDNFGKTNYGTAGYLGHGYFITVKHAVVALGEEDARPSSRKITSVKVMYQGKEIPAKVIDTGDADVEVHSGDWAIIKTRDLDLPALRADTAFSYDWADPIFRIGNDYSKGIILSTGSVGNRTANGLVTCLTDGHPGVSGGGVLDQRGDLVGIPIGRMQGDYRFSFILPLRGEMLRKVPSWEPPLAATQAVATEQQH
jgi:S1-C subfamily serine protease